ncbi:MAG: hypothetical protein ACI815_000394 [Psychroserpens sp.]|jgi:hypothetical protein
MKIFKTFTKVVLAAILLMTVGCSNDDNSMVNPEPDGPMSTGVSKTYALGSVANPDISGTAKFIENTDNSITIELELQNTPAGGMHPAHIHFNTAAEGGDIALTIGTVDGSTGKSSITVTTLDDNSTITYDQLLNFDGYINVHLSADELGTLVAQGNIGANGNIETSAKNYKITNQGATAYVFNGQGLSDVNNPALTLKRGETYTFTINTPGHPFYIKDVKGTGTANAYSLGVTNNGAINGTVTFTVPTDAPNRLYYNCEFHSLMTGVITITD